ncbi:hypothetical protein LTR28_003832, partial [Elasticomyces elasticus]
MASRKRKRGDDAVFTSSGIVNQQSEKQMDKQGMRRQQEPASATTEKNVHGFTNADLRLLHGTQAPDISLQDFKYMIAKLPAEDIDDLRQTLDLSRGHAVQPTSKSHIPGPRKLPDVVNATDGDALRSAADITGTALKTATLALNVPLPTTLAKKAHGSPNELVKVSSKRTAEETSVNPASARRTSCTDHENRKRRKKESKPATLPDNDSIPAPKVGTVQNVAPVPTARGTLDRKAWRNLKKSRRRRERPYSTEHAPTSEARVADSTTTQGMGVGRPVELARPEAESHRWKVTGDMKQKDKRLSWRTEGYGSPTLHRATVTTPPSRFQSISSGRQGLNIQREQVTPIKNAQKFIDKGSSMKTKALETPSMSRFGGAALTRSQRRRQQRQRQKMSKDLAASLERRVSARSTLPQTFDGTTLNRTQKPQDPNKACFEDTNRGPSIYSALMKAKPGARDPPTARTTAVPTLFNSNTLVHARQEKPGLVLLGKAPASTQKGKAPTTTAASEAVHNRPSVQGSNTKTPVPSAITHDEVTRGRPECDPQPCKDTHPSDTRRRGVSSDPPFPSAPSIPPRAWRGSVDLLHKTKKERVKVEHSSSGSTSSSDESELVSPAPILKRTSLYISESVAPGRTEESDRSGSVDELDTLPVLSTRDNAVGPSSEIGVSPTLTFGHTSLPVSETGAPGRKEEGDQSDSAGELDTLPVLDLQDNAVGPSSKVEVEADGAEQAAQEKGFPDAEEIRPIMSIENPEIQVISSHANDGPSLRVEHPKLAQLPNVPEPLQPSTAPILQTPPSTEQDPIIAHLSFASFNASLPESPDSQLDDGALEGLEEADAFLRPSFSDYNTYQRKPLKSAMRRVPVMTPSASDARSFSTEQHPHHGDDKGAETRPGIILVERSISPVQRSRVEPRSLAKTNGGPLQLSLSQRSTAQNRRQFDTHASLERTPSPRTAHSYEAQRARDKDEFDTGRGATLPNVSSFRNNLSVQDPRPKVNVAPVSQTADGHGVNVQTSLREAYQEDTEKSKIRKQARPKTSRTSDIRFGDDNDDVSGAYPGATVADAGYNLDQPVVTRKTSPYVLVPLTPRGRRMNHEDVAYSSGLSELS